MMIETFPRLVYTVHITQQYNTVRNSDLEQINGILDTNGALIQLGYCIVVS